MSDEVYSKLAKVLDALPNGFPAAPDGLEIRILKTIFTQEEADLLSDLRLTFETPAEIAQRSGRPLEGLEEKLLKMWERGELFGLDLETVKVFKMMPWIFGIYEFQLKRRGREFAELAGEYNSRYYFPQFYRNKPQIMQVIPIEKVIPNRQEALPYHKVSSIIENGKSFAVADCICRKQHRLLDKGCTKPMEVCMNIAPVPGAFDHYRWGRSITKEEAYEVLRKAEEAALVHLTHNVEQGHFFICNCCGCCCGVLRAINELGIPDASNSHFFAQVDPDKCVSCGTCANERCQVRAIEEDGGSYRVIRERCIGCGLCVGTCPSEAIGLVRKRREEIVTPPQDENAWLEERARQRGVDYSAYR